MNKTPAWGEYSPTSKAKCLHFLTQIGVGRGKITKKLVSLWRHHHGDWVDAEVRGIKYRLNLGDNVTDMKILVSSKEYDKKELHALKEACRDGIFVDIGANIGYYSLAIATSGAASVLAIEPNPPTLERLQFNISTNRLDQTITTVPKGIGQQGTSELFFTGDLGSASLLESSSEKAKSIRIQTQPLLDIINQNQIHKIDGMKIDVEGLEDVALLPFFETAPKTLWPSCLVVEHCHQKNWGVDIIQTLLKKGYIQTGKTRANTILTLTL